MILIFCDNQDNSATMVLDWLLTWGIPFLVVTSDQQLKITSIHSLDDPIFEFSLNGQVFSTSEIKAVWYRRSLPSIVFDRPNYSGISDHPFLDQLNRYLECEESAIDAEFREALSTIPSLGSPFHCGERTIRDLSAYSSVGGRVPRTLITSRKNELLHFWQQCSHSVVVKKINYGFYADLQDAFYGQFTELLTPAHIEQLPDQFGLTLFQEVIYKSLELRIYVLREQFYTMAIFSQDDPQTKIDFRNYNELNPNRTSPYELPDDIKELVRSFMLVIGTNSGSIDMVLTPENEYVFLEINTIGQFGMVSQVCNFNFEKAIAHELCRIANASVGLSK